MKEITILVQHHKYSSNIVQKLTVGFDFIRVVFEQVDALIVVSKLNSYHVSYIIVLK